MNTNFLKKITAGLTDLTGNDELLAHIAIPAIEGRHPSVQRVQTEVESDPLLRMLLTKSIAQAQTEPMILLTQIVLSCTIILMQ